tara:strand:- start:102 stop:404 length:303 start_codon:yes stop_codon:yes gene_type:complete
MSLKKPSNISTIILSIFSTTIYASNDTSPIISDEHGGIIVIFLTIILVLYKIFKFVLGLKNSGEESYKDQKTRTTSNKQKSQFKIFDNIYYGDSFFEIDQ